jgi:hypothetical protein
VFEAAEENGFDVLVTHNPIPDYFENPSTDAVYAEVEEALTALASGYERAHVIAPFARYLPVEAFANFEHLNPQGARHNSATLAPVVRQFLASGAEHE